MCNVMIKRFKEIHHKVCASETYEMTNVQSDKIEIQHTVRASEANWLTNVQSN